MSAGRAGLLAMLTLVGAAALEVQRRDLDAAESHDRVLAPWQLSINDATVAEWSALPGIGPALAGRLVRDRAARGPFRDADDLGRVCGIGEKTIARIAPLLAPVDRPAAPGRAR